MHPGGVALALPGMQAIDFICGLSADRLQEISGSKISGSQRYRGQALHFTNFTTISVNCKA